MNGEKNFLRKKYSSVRKQVKSAEKDESIFRKICSTDLYKSAETVFVYYSVGSEADTHKIIESALSGGKRVALPKCTDTKGIMEFYFIEDISESLTDGAFSLKEPDVSACEKAVFGDSDICFVPGLAFDLSGCRIGYGGGYYDRFLSNFKGSTIGLTYEECLCEKLPCGEYDIMVDMIITDKQIYELK